MQVSTVSAVLTDGLMGLCQPLNRRQCWHKGRALFAAPFSSPREAVSAQDHGAHGSISRPGQCRRAATTTE
eukprot:6162429-Pyramimonas_sp.AAC.1